MKKGGGSQREAGRGRGEKKGGEARQEEGGRSPPHADTRAGFGGVEGPQWDHGLLGRVSDLSGVVARGSPPHAVVPNL
jgi:hypothetical protein